MDAIYIDPMRITIYSSSKVEIFSRYFPKQFKAQFEKNNSVINKMNYKMILGIEKNFDNKNPRFEYLLPNLDD